MMEVHVLLAMTKSRVYRTRGDFMEHLRALPSDQMRRLAHIRDQCVIVGSRHWKKVRPIEARDVIVISNRARVIARISDLPYTHVVSSLEQAVLLAEELGYSTCWVLGGATTIVEALPRADWLHVTWLLDGECIEGEQLPPLKEWRAVRGSRREKAPEGTGGLVFVWEKFEKRRRRS